MGWGLGIDAFSNVQSDYMKQTRIGSLGWEDPLKKRKATHSSVLA